jgi:diguanylate cyclase (GGDEF)-like protein/PAS domain S-box-containing protein
MSSQVFKPKFLHRLSFRLARSGVIIALLVSLISSGYQVYNDFRVERNTLDDSIERVLDASRFAASRAVHTLDYNLASEVVNGMFVYDFVTYVAIIDELGSPLAERSVKQEDRQQHWYGSFIGNRIQTLETRLETNALGSDVYGVLRMNIDKVIAYQSFADRAISTFILGVVKNFIMILLFLAVFYRLVTKPISQMSGALDAIDTDNPEGERLTPPGSHERDELGQLTAHINNYLSNTERLINDKTQAQHEVGESYNNMRRLIDNLPHLIYVKNQAGELVLVNEAFSRTFNFDVDDLTGTHQSQLLGEYDEKTRQLIVEAEDQVLSDQHSLFIPEIDWINSHGTVTALELLVLPIEFRGEPAILSVGVDITERKRNQSRMQHMAYHDPLTDLPNRHLFLDRLGQSLRRAERSGQFGALVFIDLDNFKNINDSLGHSAGDALLRDAASRLLEAVRNEDTVSRLGGDEFVICMADMGSDKSEVSILAHQRAERLRQSLSQPFFISGQQSMVTASLGIALYPDGSTSASDLLRNADTAMYQAKAHGKDNSIQFEQAMAEATAFRLSMEKDLRLAVERREFYLTFQPQVDVRDNTIIGAEALMRWHHPTRGTVSPAEFIPILENMGLIVNVGEWALDEACATVRRWIDAGIWRSDQVMGINVSPQQFSQPEFFAQVKRAISHYDIPASCIDLEITEGMVINEVEETIVRMNEIRGHGVTFSIDDFGTGYSSLSYLKRLPLDVLKVDQSFVRDLTTDTNDAAIVETILAMAQHLNLKTIAEGVETAEQLAFLESIGCLRYQGYLFSAPLMSDDFMTLLQNNPTTATV